MSSEFVSAVQVRVGDRVLWDRHYCEVVDWKPSDEGRYLILQTGPSRWRQVHYRFGQRVHAQIVERASDRRAH